MKLSRTNLKMCSVPQIFILPPGKLSQNSISSHDSPLGSWLQDSHSGAFDSSSWPKRRERLCVKPAQYDAVTHKGGEENRKEIWAWNMTIIRWCSGLKGDRKAGDLTETVDWKRNEKHVLMRQEIFKINVLSCRFIKCNCLWGFKTDHLWPPTGWLGLRVETIWRKWYGESKGLF